MSAQNFESEFILAKKIIVDAGKIALSYFEQPLTSKLKENELISSIVTKADEESEAFIREKLEEKFPDYGFIGEETEENNKEIAWIVDPIDGTLAFSRGLPEFGMAIALKNGTNIIFSVMYLPTVDKLYSAYSGQGAFLNDKRISVSNPNSLHHSIISLHQKGLKEDRYNTYALSILNLCTVRMHFSAVVESCNMAEGKIDGLIKFDQKIWDIAPEYLLMVEAGAKVTDEFNKPLLFNFSKNSQQTFVAIPRTLNSSEQNSLYLFDK